MELAFCMLNMCPATELLFPVHSEFLLNLLGTYDNLCIGWVPREETVLEVSKGLFWAFPFVKSQMYFSVDLASNCKADLFFPPSLECRSEAHRTETLLNIVLCHSCRFWQYVA